jgi:hypothetical protein
MQIFETSEFDGRVPGADPTTVSYNADVVNVYNSTSGLVRFETKNTFIYKL